MKVGMGGVVVAAVLLAAPAARAGGSLASALDKAAKAISKAAVDAAAGVPAKGSSAKAGTGKTDKYGTASAGYKANAAAGASATGTATLGADGLRVTPVPSVGVSAPTLPGAPATGVSLDLGALRQALGARVSSAVRAATSAKGFSAASVAESVVKAAREAMRAAGIAPGKRCPPRAEADALPAVAAAAQGALQERLRALARTNPFSASRGPAVQDIVAGAQASLKEALDQWGRAIRECTEKDKVDHPIVPRPRK